MAFGVRRSMGGDSNIEFYRQPGGCVEVWQGSPPDNTQQDVIHLCDREQITQFMAEFAQFVADTRRVGTDGA